jgi:hypothetical protein
LPGAKHAVENERLDRAARPDPRRRIEAQRLVDGQPEVERRILGQRGVARELVEEEGDGRGRGVVAGEHQRHDLVADVALGERGALLVGGLQEQAEDVLAAFGARPPAIDLVEDQRVQPRPGADHPPPRRAGPAQDLARVVARPEAERLLELVGRVEPARARPVGIQPEERAHRDPQRQLAGEPIEVEGRFGADAIERLARLDGHHRVGGLDTLAMEGREHDLAALAVEVAVDGEQAVAQQRDEVTHEPTPPREVGGVRDGDEVVRLGAQHEDHVGVKDADREHAPEALVAVEQERQRRAREAARPAQVDVGEAGREGDRGRALEAQIVVHAGDRVGGDRRRRRERHGPLTLT